MCTSGLIIRSVRAFWRIVCRIVLWIRVVGAFLLRGICICRVMGVVNWRRREIGAAWVCSLRLIVANSAVWWRCVVMTVLIGCVRFAVFIVAVYIQVSFRVSARTSIVCTHVVLRWHYACAPCSCYTHNQQHPQHRQRGQLLSGVFFCSCFYFCFHV